jgi:hypothetical protein
MANMGFVRSAGLLCAIGGLLQLVLGPEEAFSPTQPSSSEFIFENVLVTISHVLVFIGVIGLARSGAAENGWLAKIGLGIALLGSFLTIPSEIILLVDRLFALGETLLPICALLMGVGMLLAGIAVLRTRRWLGWHQYTPLICGLYVFVVLFPGFAISFAIAEGVGFLALGGWGLCWLLLGAALRAEAGARHVAQSTDTIA